MIRRTYLFILSGITLAFGCQSPPETSESATADTTSQEVPVKQVLSPASVASGEPNLFVDPSGQVYLSWVEEVESGHELRYAAWQDEQWSSPQTIAQGDNWFVNWADFPSMAVTDAFAAAHWLQKSAEGTYDYDVQVALSPHSQEHCDPKDIGGSL